MAPESQQLTAASFCSSVSRMPFGQEAAAPTPSALRPRHVSVSKANHDCSAPHMLWSILLPLQGTLSPVAVPDAHGAFPTTATTGLVSAWENRLVPNSSCPQSTSHQANKPAALDSISEHVTSFQKDFSSCSLLTVITAIPHGAHCVLGPGGGHSSTSASCPSPWLPSFYSLGPTQPLWGHTASG